MSALTAALIYIFAGLTAKAPDKPFQFVTSKHKDLTERLKAINRPLYQQVRSVLEINKAERHIRGGIATRRKYKGV